MSTGDHSPKDRFLRISEAAAIVGVSVDTLRHWDSTGVLHAHRTPSGQRQYLLRDVEEYVRRKKGTAPALRTAATPNSPTPKAAPAQAWAQRPTIRGRPLGPMGPWDDEVAEANAQVQILRAQAESDALRRASTAEAEAAARRAEDQRVASEMERRLEELKSFGRSLAINLPANWMARVVAMLEEFVTARQFPRSLSDREAYVMVRAHVDHLVTELRVKDDEANSRAWAKMDREREDTRRAQRLEVLLNHGRHLGTVNTIGWERDDRVRALRDIDRELRAQVQSDWNEDDVRDLITEILEDWLADEDEDDDWGDEEDNP
jgi:excisionase family DNA binding protein